MHVWACTSLHTTPTPVFFFNQSSCGILTLYLLLFVLVGGGGQSQLSREAGNTDASQA